MIRGLTMIAVGGAVVSALCFGVAASRGPTSFSFSDIEWADTAPSGPQTTRTLAWNGGPELTINLPASIIIQQGPKAEITLSGSEHMVNHIVLNGTTLDTDENTPNHHYRLRDAKVRLTITAPDLTKLTLNGFGSVNWQGYDQKTLDLIINGAASVKAHGRAENVTLTIDGAASVNLADMDITNLDVAMDGAGSVKAGPTGLAKITIDGAGSVKLTKVPMSFSKQIDGVGSVSVPKGTPDALTQSKPPHPADKTPEQSEEDLSF